MAEKKKAPSNGKNGIDRWTSNGVGIKLSPMSAAQKKQIERLNKELSGAHKKRGD